MLCYFLDYAGLGLNPLLNFYVGDFYVGGVMSQKWIVNWVGV